MPGVRVATGGQALILTAFTFAGSNQNLYTDAALSLQVTFPIAVGTDTTYYYSDAVSGQCQLAVSEANGMVLGNFVVQAYPGMTAGVAPRMTQAQIEGAVSDGSGGPAGLHGYAAWTFDPALAGTTFVLATAGTVYTARLIVPVSTSVTNVVTALQVAGGTLTASQCLTGLYGPTGTLIGTSADQSTPWGSTGVKVAALTGGPFVCPAGIYTAAFMFNGTTGPSLIAGNSQSVGGVNAGIAATQSRFGTADTGRTTTLAATLGTVAASVRSIWAALS